MGELIPPGSVVEVDVTQNAVQVSDWKNIRERPVYLVWHTEGHSCCWCHLEGKELTLLPYPLSRQSVRRFKVPREASVIGRVVNAWLPFNQPTAGSQPRLAYSKECPRQPRSGHLEAFNIQDLSSTPTD